LKWRRFAAIGSSVRRAILLLLFFASGCAALIYELVWFHQVQLVVGASSLSMAVLLSSFMGGMALGSALLPRLVGRERHPLRVVAGLEAGIAVLGILIPLTLPFVRYAYVALAGYGYANVLLRALVCAVVLLPPTVLMGATLPAISRWRSALGANSSAVGFLYMANIAGAAFGTALAGFYLLRVYDTVIASGVAVAINIVVAIVALAAASPAGHAVPEEEPGAAAGNAEVGGAPQLTIYLAATLSGLTALGAEVVWTRQLSLLFGASVYTFSLILATFLAGLGIGSFIGSMIARRSAAPAMALAGCQIALASAIAFAAWTIVTVLPTWQPSTTFLPRVRASAWLTFAFDSARCLAAMLPATLLWGASFPLALAAAARSGSDPARTVARVNAMNTIGSLAGALLFTLIGVPYLGSQHAQQVLVVLAVITTILLLRESPTAFWGLSVVVAVVSIMVVRFVPPTPGGLIAYGRSVSSWSSIKNYLYVAEGATASIAVTEDVAGARQFHIAGKVEASNMDVDMRLERMLGHLPALLHPNPRKILIVGVGAGVTAGALVVHPEVERMVICEIEPRVPESARRYFADENHHVFDSPKVQLVFDDARHFLQTTQEKFDIITSDPIHPWVRGAATLYSEEYLQLVKAHLNHGGVVTQWVPLYETDVPSVKSELATFVSVFPDTTLWSPDFLEEGYDLVALGRLDGGPINQQTLGRRILQSADVATSLAEVSLGSAGGLLATYAGRSKDLAPWLADAVINRERHLRLQYLAGLAANFDDRYGIFQAILQYRRYPADLFQASAETEGQLQKWYLP
jgi:spermidine synthase